MIRISLCFEPARGGDGPVRPVVPLSVTAVWELTQLLNHELNLTPRYRSLRPPGGSPGPALAGTDRAFGVPRRAGRQLST